jgi:hypothetical protein
MAIGWRPIRFGRGGASGAAQRRGHANRTTRHEPEVGASAHLMGPVLDSDSADVTRMRPARVG